MNYPNLSEIIKYHPYHIHTFANFANVTQRLMEAALIGKEKLTEKELSGIAKYTGIPFSVLQCRKLIVLNKNNYRHRKMMQTLEEYLRVIWTMEKRGSREAAHYMKYRRIDYVNMALDFQNKKSITYGRYLGIREAMEQTLDFIHSEQIKPRDIRA